MRGLVPSTLLRLWEAQCLHKAVPRQRGGTRFVQAGQAALEEVQAAEIDAQPMRGIVPSTLLRLWEGQSRSPPGSGEVQPHQFQPGKYDIFLGRGKSNQAAVEEVQAEIDARAALQAHAWNFVCGSGSASTRP